jgi:MFS family permease
MDLTASDNAPRRGRRLRLILLAVWGVGMLAGSVGFLIVIATWGTAELHPAWELIFGVGMVVSLITPVVVGIWAVVSLIRRLRRDTTPRSG